MRHDELSGERGNAGIRDPNTLSHSIKGAPPLWGADYGEHVGTPEDILGAVVVLKGV
jgi:hypothetical protein